MKPRKGLKPRYRWNFRSNCWNRRWAPMERVGYWPPTLRLPRV